MIRKGSNGRWCGEYIDPMPHRRRTVYGRTQEEVLRKLQAARNHQQEGIC